MPLFTRKPSLDEAVEAIKAHLRERPTQALPADLVELVQLLRRRDGVSSAPGVAAELVLDALPDAAALVGAGGVLLARNPLFDALLGSHRATVLDATRSGELHDGVSRALAGWPERRELLLPSLGLTVQAVASPIPPGRALLVLRDLTAQRRAEAVRRDFIANASHELRTPVTAILGASEALLSSGFHLEDSVRHFTELIDRQAQRMQQLTSDLLDLSRLEAGEWKVEPEALDLATVCRAVVELLHERAARKQLSLECTVPDGLPVRSDRRALEQILVNLLDNAVKYTPEKGRILVEATPMGVRTEVAVVDTGPGIEPRHQQRIFERFYRVDAGRSREQGGTGLGLSIVRHLTNLLGGEVELESGRNGSRFWLRLPSA